MSDSQEQRRYLEGMLPSFCCRCYRRLVLTLLCFADLLLILFIATSVLLSHWAAVAELDVAPWAYWTSVLAPALAFVVYYYLVSRDWFDDRLRRIGWIAAIVYHTMLLFLMISHVLEAREYADRQAEVIYLAVMVGSPAFALLLCLQAYCLTIPRGKFRPAPPKQPAGDSVQSA
ncbi:MAG: hypothetical protein AAGK14_04945 [Verrucomicrobiota bacterium]